MDPEIDRQISEHVSRMHRYCADDRGNQYVASNSCIFHFLVVLATLEWTGMGGLEKSLRYTEDDDGDVDTSVFVKYDRALHGQERKKGKKQKHERLTINFLKKYIYYAKSIYQPKLTDEVILKTTFLFMLQLNYKSQLILILSKFN